MKESVLIVRDKCFAILMCAVLSVVMCATAAPAYAAGKSLQSASPLGVQEEEVPTLRVGSWNLEEQYSDQGVIAPTEPGVSYDLNSNTLTLNNVDITCTDGTAAIYYDDYRNEGNNVGNLTIKLIGTNKIHLTENWQAAIKGSNLDSLTITGGGSLSVTGGQGAVVFLVDGNPNTTIENVTISTNTAGIVVENGTLSIVDSTVNIKSSISRKDGFYGLESIDTLSVKNSQVQIMNTAPDDEYYDYGVRLLHCDNLILEGVKVYTGEGSAQCTLTKKDLYDSYYEGYALDGHYLLLSPKSISVPAGIVADPTVSFVKSSLKYSGKNHTPTLVVKVKGKQISSSNYEADWGQSPGAVGDHMVDVRLKGIYIGSIKYVEYKISKGDNPLVVKPITVTFKRAKVKQKAQTAKTSKAFSVKKAQGKVTYKKKKGNKNISVSSTGAITVKKGLAKGTYKVQVQVKAAGNANYTAASRTVTLKVRVA